MDSVTEFEEWQCCTCTFINKERQNRCKICYTRRPTTDISDYQFGAVGGNTYSQCQAAVSREWQCNRCTLINSDSSSVCITCLRKRPPYELRFVIIGKTGSGKSATGNTILNQMHFESMVSGGSVTNQCKFGNALRMGRKLVVIDTPGLFDTGMSNEIVTKEIAKCIGMTAPGPHAFLLAVNVGRFTKEEQDTVKHFVNHFGEGLYRYLVVVFTKSDELERDNVSIGDYVKRSPPALKEVLDRCGGKYIPFNNRDSESGKEQQVQNLVALVDDIVNQNGGQYYTNEMYVEAEKTLKRREAEIKRQLEYEERMKIDNIRQEYEQKIKHQNRIAQENQIQMKLDRERLETLETKYREDCERKLKESASQDRLTEERKKIDKMRQEYERKLKNQNKREQEEKMKMKREQERREERIREEYERKMEASALRDRSRQEVQEEKGFFSHVKDGLISFGKGILSIFS